MKKCRRAAAAWYERPPEFVRRSGLLVDVTPRRMVKLCRAHRRESDELVDLVAGGRCGFGFSSPPIGGVFIERKRVHR